MPFQSAILPHNNARRHTAELTKEKFDKIRQKTQQHPPYSPDLSPRDYHVFGPLKEELGGRHFDDDDGAQLVGYRLDQIHSLMIVADLSLLETCR